MGLFAGNPAIAHLTLRLALGQLQALIDRFVSVSANLAFARMPVPLACMSPFADSNPAFVVADQNRE